MHQLPCAHADDCHPGKRWDCSEKADWLGSHGLSPWNGDSPAALLRYLGSATPSELAQMAEYAANALDWGDWHGVLALDPGQTDGLSRTDGEPLWRAAAKDFLDRYQLGEHRLTEGVLWHARRDLACELAWLRGWCPLAGGQSG